MNYKLIISDNTKTKTEQLLYYLLYNLYNEDAAQHFIEELEQLYIRILDNPYSFSICIDPFLSQKQYRIARFSKLKYFLIIKIENDNIFIVGIFHELENYFNKLNA